ncbi:hypothetical protein BKA61DRAFT_72133 [Leptodontidium sp. MPI-SDFR-AT-0119]|nr:hypothetical protein BKA61DRAFT_72133 [Leptodontidium sp. MPI-SDFR-AT-0119]
MRRTAKKCADFRFVRNHVNRTKKGSRTPFHLIINFPYDDISSRPCDFDLCRVMAEEGAIDILIDDPSILKDFRGSVERLRFIHQQSLPAYTLNSQYRAQEHIAIAAGLAHGWPWETDHTLNVEYWLDANSNTKDEMTDWVNSQGRSFLHCLARGFGQFSWATNYREMNPQKEHDAARAWHRLICRSISAGCSLFSVDYSGKTILSTVIDEYLEYYSLRDKPRWDMKLVLREWLEALAGCGIDLLAYGDVEKAHWQSGNWGYQCSCPQSSANGNMISCKDEHVSYRHYPKTPSHSIFYPRRGVTVSFSHGPRPRDWIFEAYTPAKAYAGEFWRLAEGGVVEEPCLIGDSDDESSSEEEWSEDEEESVQDPVAQPVPGPWSQDFEC